MWFNRRGLCGFSRKGATLMTLKYEDHACKCCGENLTQLDFYRNLSIALSRLHFIDSGSINSGYRCPENNTKCGGSPTSSHMRGLAADIRCTTSRERYQILNALLTHGFSRIGIYRSFIHVDDDKNKPGFVIWRP